MEKCKRKKTGFTLIELLVVLAIIGMLAGIVLVSLGTARQRARDVRRMSDIRQLVTAQQMYEGEHNGYYTASATTGIPAIGSYMPAVDDPQAPGKHYTWINNENSPDKFCAYAVLEDKGSCSDARYFIGYWGGTRESCTKPETLDACAPTP